MWLDHVAMAGVVKRGSCQRRKVQASLEITRGDG
jgi:hypothetical protein